MSREELTGRYFRLGLMTAAHGTPCLTVPEWREWMQGWLREYGIQVLIVDTATATTNVDPWGKDIQAAYLGLCAMQAAYPELAIILAVHLRKPPGRGERRLSDVMGEWGRWCDVVILQENDGNNLNRAKLTIRKRVRRERRIVVTKRDGLLVDPQELETAGPKVPMETVVKAINDAPGLSYSRLGEALGVTREIAANYVREAVKQRLATMQKGARGAILVFPFGHSLAGMEEPQS